MKYLILLSIWALMVNTKFFKPNVNMQDKENPETDPNQEAHMEGYNQ